MPWQRPSLSRRQLTYLCLRKTWTLTFLVRQQKARLPVQPTPQAAPTAGGSPTATPVAPTLGAEQLQQLMLQMLNNQNTALQQQQNQMNFLMQAQSAQLTLWTRRFDEEEARRKAEEARRAVSADPFAAASAGGTSAAPTTSPVAPGVPASASFSSGAVVVQRSTCHPCRSSIMVR